MRYMASSPHWGANYWVNSTWISSVCFILCRLITPIETKSSVVLIARRFCLEVCVCQSSARNWTMWTNLNKMSWQMIAQPPRYYEKTFLVLISLNLTRILFIKKMSHHFYLVVLIASLASCNKYTKLFINQFPIRQRF